MSSYRLSVHGDKLVQSFPIVLPVFSFLPPSKIFTFQFSTSCLAKSSESPAREEKLNHIDDPSAVEEHWDCDPKRGKGSISWDWAQISIYISKEG